MIVKSQHGQSMVEFAIVLPFFLLFVFAIMALTFMFADYVSVQSEARNIARVCSVYTDDSTAKEKIVEAYKRNNDNKTTLPLFLYHCDINSDDLSIVYRHRDDKDGNGYWTVALEAEPQDTNSGLWGMAFALIDKEDRPDIASIRTSCTMYSENNLTTNSNGT